ncbi:MAG TPA: dihydroorotate dehydrogenase [Acidimicrobiales bacterium]|nr:dihydroorotate dehydrogenase [Acidimicrobiales bacterium]
MSVDLTSKVGSLELPNPVMTASGCAGHSDELGRYFPLSDLGAVVVKSLAAFEWAGNPAPRLHPVTGGMLNSVGLQGPGITAWLAHDLPRLERAGARVVASIWGRSVEQYREAAKLLADAPSTVVAVEVNLSCPNLDGGAHLFAHSPSATAAAIEVALACGRPVWAKLSPNTDQLVAVASAAREAGAEAVTLVNTVLGMVIDIDARRPALGAGGGGLSGRAIHPVAVRAVHDVHAALPDLPIVGVGGVATGEDAVELLMAGASAVQVGTATFADPKAPRSVLEGLGDWCERHSVAAVRTIVGAAHEDRRDG